MLSLARQKQLEILLKNINLTMDDLELVNEALTHPSYNFERNQTGKDYERLEFLGDSVVRLIVSNYLYDLHKDYDEGKLTKLRSYLVSDGFFSKIALKMKLNEYINIGIHEEKDGGRTKESILACSLEALFGAAFKNLGFESVKMFVYSIYDEINIDDTVILNFYNSKEILQQYTQGKNKNLPQYKIIEESGLSHNKTYKVCVYYEGEELGTGKAKTKKEAEKIAAMNALKKLGIYKDNINE